MSVENDEIMLDETVYWFMLQPRMADPETVSVMAKEVLDLRDRVRELEDQLRWRKWPEEEPKEPGQYLVLDCRGLAEVNYVMIGEDAGEGEWVPFPDQLRYWRPVGPLPVQHISLNSPIE